MKDGDETIKKKLFLVAIMCVLSTLFVGCTSDMGSCMSETIPRVEIVRSCWTSDTIAIPLGDYEYKSYEEIENEDGSKTVIIVFDKENK